MNFISNKWVVFNQLTLYVLYIWWVQVGCFLNRTDDANLGSPPLVSYMFDEECWVFVPSNDRVISLYDLKLTSTHPVVLPSKTLHLEWRIQTCVLCAWWDPQALAKVINRDVSVLHQSLMIPMISACKWVAVVYKVLHSMQTRYSYFCRRSSIQHDLV